MWRPDGESIPAELRERVVSAFNEGEGTYDEIAERFKVGRASVIRWVALERDEAPWGEADGRSSPQVPHRLEE